MELGSLGAGGVLGLWSGEARKEHVTVRSKVGRITTERRKVGCHQGMPDPQVSKEMTHKT